MFLGIPSSGINRHRRNFPVMSSRSRSSSNSSKKSHSRSRSSKSSRSRSRSPSVDENCRLHVADLGQTVSKNELTRVFEKYGPLKEVWVASSPPCFAFVVFENREDAEEAIQGVDNTNVGGNRVRVTVARPRTRGRGLKSYDPNQRCYTCGERGHFSRDCSDTKYGYKRPSRRSPPYRSRPRRYNNYEDFRRHDRRDRDYDDRRRRR